MVRFLSLIAILIVVGCSRTTPPQPQTVETPGPSIEPSEDILPSPRVVGTNSPSLNPVTIGVAYLLNQQFPDGSWHSDVYAAFKDGTALTPLVLCSLLDAADAGMDSPTNAQARKKAVTWLAKFVKPDGSIDPGQDGFEYSIYTAALTLKALSHKEHAEHSKTREAWAKFIKDRQLTEKLGWKPEDKQYGGWGYCRVVPRKPEPGQLAPPLIESNLSATVFAVEALKAAGALDAETAKAAAVFIRRCQNEDGGFHFIYDDPVRNKAGSPDPPGAKEARFHSYGSTTADGLRALCLSNLPEDKGNIERARAWLAKHFRADTHPGEYTRALEPNREAVYYYYSASVARALRERKAEKAGGMDWAATLQKELGKRQRDDGSWANPVELVRENDPIVATAAAVSALANCR